MKKLIKFFLSKRNKIKVSYDSDIALKTINNIGEGTKVSQGVSCSDLVSIGRFSSINGPNTKITAKINKVFIGNFCSIAPGVQIQEYYHKYDRISSCHICRNIFGKSIFNDIYSKGDIVIEDDVWIGANAVILSGVRVGRGAIIGAGSIVIKDIPSYSIAAGNPAKVIKKRFATFEMETTLESLRWWEWDINKIRENKDIFELSEKELVEKFNQ